MLLVDLRPFKLSGAKAEYILEELSIACNKNTVPGDKSALNPSGIRLGKFLIDLSIIKFQRVSPLGTPALTTRGFKEEDIDQVVDFMDKGLKLGKEIATKSGPKLVDFKKAVHEGDFREKIERLRNEIEAFSEKFPMPGYEGY